MKNILLILGVVLAASLTIANDLFPTEGLNLSYEAGHCPVGPFGRDGDVGVYKGHCSDLTTNEICIAYLNGVDSGEIIDLDTAKIRFCEGVLFQQAH